MSQRLAWPAVPAALSLAVAGPSTERFDTTHGPRLVRCTVLGAFGLGLFEAVL